MKSMILMVSVPLACLAGGYGAGQFLLPAETLVASAEPTTLTDAAPGRPGDHAALGIPEAPVDPHADTAKAHAADDGYGAKGETAPPLLQIGRLTVPVLKARSITYVVAEIALAMPEAALVTQVEDNPETLLRMRDAVLASLTEAAATPAMAGPAIDTAALSERVLADLKAIGMPIDDVLFPNLFKQDVARRDIPQAAAAHVAPTAEAPAVTH